VWTKSRDAVSVGWWPTLTRISSLKTNNLLLEKEWTLASPLFPHFWIQGSIPSTMKFVSQITQTFRSRPLLDHNPSSNEHKQLPTCTHWKKSHDLDKKKRLVDFISVLRVRPRTSKGHHRPVIASNFHPLSLNFFASSLLSDFPLTENQSWEMKLVNIYRVVVPLRSDRNWLTSSQGAREFPLCSPFLPWGRKEKQRENESPTWFDEKPTQLFFNDDVSVTIFFC